MQRVGYDALDILEMATCGIADAYYMDQRLAAEHLRCAPWPARGVMDLATVFPSDSFGCWLGAGGTQ